MQVSKATDKNIANDTEYIPISYFSPTNHAKGVFGIILPSNTTKLLRAKANSVSDKEIRTTKQSKNGNTFANRINPILDLYTKFISFAI